MSLTANSNSNNLTAGRSSRNSGAQSTGDLTFREYVEVFGSDLKPVLEDKIVSLNEEIERFNDLREAKVEALQRIFERHNLLGRKFSKWFWRTWLKYDKLLTIQGIHR